MRLDPRPAGDSIARENMSTGRSVLAGTALLALLSCGGSATASGASRGALRAAVEQNLESVKAGDADAVFNAQSKRCKRINSLAQMRTTLRLMSTLVPTATRSKWKVKITSI